MTSSARLFRRRLLPTLLLIGASLTAAPALDFLHLTDTHVTDLREVAEPIAKARVHFKDTGAALEKFFGGEVRGLGVDFVLITGDLIDGFSFVSGDGRRVYGQIDAFLRATRPCPVPLFVLLGNHDLSHYSVSAAGKPAADQSVAGEARAAWMAAVPALRQGTQYAFSKQAGATKVTFVLLDNGYSAAGSDDKGGFRMAHEQLFWLRRQMEASADAMVIVALHVPLGADGNSQAIKAELARAKNVALVLAGHVHKDGIDEVSLGETARTVQVRTAAFGYGPTHWRRVRVHPDRIEVFATGSADKVERTIAARK